MDSFEGSGRRLGTPHRQERPLIQGWFQEERRFQNRQSVRFASDEESEASNQHDNKTESYHGYKVNFITDANYGLPLFAATRPANASDVAVMIQDLDDCLELYPTLKPKYFLSDKGYDSLGNIKHVVSLGMIPVMAVRRPEKDKETGKRLYDGIYDEDGRPTCVGGKSMEYVETDPKIKGTCSGVRLQGCPLKDIPSSSRGTATMSTTRSLRDGC